MIEGYKFDLISLELNLKIMPERVDRRENKPSFIFILILFLEIFGIQVFFGVVMFGLYQGLCFLPVMLSLIGPAPYESAVSRHEIRALERSRHHSRSADDDGEGHHSHHKRTNHGVVATTKSNGHANHGFALNEMVSTN